MDQRFLDEARQRIEESKARWCVPDDHLNYLEGQGYLPVSDVINGVLQPVTPAYAIYPAAFGPNPIMHDFYSTQPSTPPYAGGAGGGAYMSAGGTDTANNTAAQVAAANPFHPRHSPLIWSVAFLLIGLIGLRIIHWG